MTACPAVSNEHTNQSRRSPRSMHDSMPSGLDAGRDHCTRRQRSVDHFDDDSRRGDGRRRNTKPPSSHDSMPASLDYYGREDHGGRRRRRSGSERKRSGCRAPSRDFNASMPDRMDFKSSDNDRRHRGDSREKGGLLRRNVEAMNASMLDRMKFSDGSSPSS